MKTNNVLKLLVIGLVVGAAGFAEAASKLRLIHGEKWSKVSRDVKKTVTSSAFKAAARGEFVVECFHEEGGRACPENLGSLKLPVIFAISEGGNCYCVIEGVPGRMTAQQILGNLRKVDAFRKKAEKEGLNTAEACGQFLAKMERFVGGPKRVVSKGFYQDVFEKLKKLDPQDETGWVRHFTMGDGIDIVTKANKFREDGDFYGGEKYVSHQQNELPVKHLTLEQKQSLLMARFALYREDTAKRPEMIELLKKIAAAGEDTFWGTAAVGWLHKFGESPLSTYWGWRKGDFTGPSLKQAVKYGVDWSFPKSGLYTIAFETNSSSSDTPRFESVELYVKDQLIVTADKPKIEGRTTTFECKVPRKKYTHMIVKGTANPSGDSQGKIVIHRQVLKPRKEAKSGSVGSIKKSDVSAYIVKTVGDETLKDIAKREKGSEFLKQFFGDVEWMEQFAGSGPWNTNPWRDGEFKGNAQARLDSDKLLASKALKALDVLVWNDKGEFITTTKIGRNIATALALNHGASFSDEKLVQVMECYREWAADGTLFDDAYKHDVFEWREAVAFGQNSPLPVENLRWIHDFCNIDWARYAGVCWVCHYRLWNCFGASVHTGAYYEPWHHRWNTQELRYRVGAVCGGISKFGSHAAAAHGIRSYTAGQPGHCAYMLWNYDRNKWDIAYAVTAHTGAHFSLGGTGFAAAEEWNRYFTHPKRMEAERLRWKGEYAKAMELVPGNYQAAEDWLLQLQVKNAPEAEWKPFAAAVCKTFSTSPQEGWALYNKYLTRLEGRGARLEAVKTGLASFTEHTDHTVEDPYFDELCLDPVAKLFPDDEKALWEIMDTALTGQAKTKSFYRQAMNWFAGKLMTDQSRAKMFMKIVVSNAKKTGAKLDYNGMIQKAAESEDIAMFHQVYRLRDYLEPNAKPKSSGDSYPTEKNGGKLVSQEGLLKPSSTTGALNYLYALDEKKYQIPNAFHTGGGKEPYAVVKLKGETNITAITVVNAGEGSWNPQRQIPLCIWVSDDGQEWSRQVYKCNELKNEWECVLPSPQKARFVKVGREPNAKDDVFHLKKILVYGVKLY